MLHDDMAGSAQRSGSGARPPRELAARIASGLVLGGVALFLAYAGPLPFAVLALVIGLLMSWEWCRVVGHRSAFDAPQLVHWAGVVLGAGLTAAGRAGLGLLVVFGLSVVLLVISLRKGAGIAALGLLYVGLPVIALVWLRNDESFGFAAILFIFLVCWTTDTAAYFFGRSIGGPKLWPRVSPGKTWSGLIGGVGSSALAAGIFAHWLPGASALPLAAGGLVLGLVAQAGDLGESALKRQFGVKDTSSLIPGHGGFMDRMDGVVVVAVAAAAFALIVNPQSPAKALLLGG